MTDKSPATGDLKIICIEDCGNAPRKRVLLEFNVAFAKGDLAFILEHVTNDILWDRVGNERIRGKDRLIETLERFKDHHATEIRIDNIITHGYTAALNGTLTFGEKRYSYCDVYVFNGASKNAKIKEITTYAIDVS